MLVGASVRRVGRAVGVREGSVAVGLTDRVMGPVLVSSIVARSGP